MPPKRVPLHVRTTQDATDLPSSPSTEESPLWGSARHEHVVVDLELREIMPNRHQPRTNPADANLDELAVSIRTHGVIQPIIVRSIPLTKYDGTGRRYELIAGERRWRASALAGRETIPALIRAEDADHRTMRELALIENIQRQDLHPLDEATAFGQLKEDLGYSYSDIAAQIGKSKSYVTNRMRLLQLDDDLRALVAARPDTIKHVYELARIPDPALRADLVAAVRDDDLSRAATSARVDALLGGGFSAKSVSQDTERDILHNLLPSESVSQDTERDTLHNLLTPESVSQDTERDVLHNLLTPESVSQDTERDTLHNLLPSESVSQDTERDALHNLLTPESVSQDTERDVLHNLLTPESVSQDTERDVLHNLLTPESVSQDTERDALHNVIALEILDRQLSKDFHTIEQILHRWEAYSAHDHGNSRAALVHIIATLNTHLKRISHVILSEPDRSVPHPLEESTNPPSAVE